MFDVITRKFGTGLRDREHVVGSILAMHEREGNDLIYDISLLNVLAELISGPGIAVHAVSGFFFGITDFSGGFTQNEFSKSSSKRRHGI